jgi:PIN domain nuclease of toxin-antitoxin system
VYVLDASAVLAFLYREPGAEDVATRLSGSLISTVNFSEVLQKANSEGFDLVEVGSLRREMVDGVVPFDDAMAVDAAGLWETTRVAGLSLADRACLALTAAVGGVAVTTDSAWARLEVPGAVIHLIQR